MRRWTMWGFGLRGRCCRGSAYGDARGPATTRCRCRVLTARRRLGRHHEAQRGNAAARGCRRRMPRNPGDSAPVTVRVDNTAPGAVPVDVSPAVRLAELKRLRPHLGESRRGRPRTDRGRPLSPLSRRQVPTASADSASRRRSTASTISWCRARASGSCASGARTLRQPAAGQRLGPGDAALRPGASPARVRATAVLGPDRGLGPGHGPASGLAERPDRAQPRGLWAVAGAPHREEGDRLRRPCRRRPLPPGRTSYARPLATARRTRTAPTVLVGRPAMSPCRCAARPAFVRAL